MYSGKCDFYDYIEIHQDKDSILNAKIYVGDSNTPLEVHSMVDLIPYYPYIISVGAHNGKDHFIRLTSKPYTDIEEEDSLKFYLELLLKYYRKCKRKKIEFDVDEAVKSLSFSFNQDVIRELAERVKKYGKKATYEGLHLVSKDFYRKELVDEMLINGLNPADYGYERFCE